MAGKITATVRVRQDKRESWGMSNDFVTVEVPRLTKAEAMVAEGTMLSPRALIFAPEGTIDVESVRRQIQRIIADRELTAKRIRAERESR